MSERQPDFECFVPGIPRPQGSKTRNANGSMREASKYVKEWRMAVHVMALKAFGTPFAGCGRQPLDGALMLGVEFLFPRPKKHWCRCSACTRRKTGACPRVHRRDGAILRNAAPVYMTGKPDKDKLVRAVGDALVLAGVVRDDSLFVKDHESGCKRYANPGEQPGAWIRIWKL